MSLSVDFLFFLIEKIIISIDFWLPVIGLIHLLALQIAKKRIRSIALVFSLLIFWILAGHPLIQSIQNAGIDSVLELRAPDGREVIFEMAREVCNKKGNLGVIFNASNEIAVDAFINKSIDFVDIYKVIQRTFDHFSCSKVSTLDDIFEYDKQARIQTEKVIKSLH